MTEYDIAIGRDEYVELLNVDFHHGLLLDTLFNAARLNYDGKSLVFDCYELTNIIKLIAPHRYEKTFNALKEMDADE